MSAGQIWASLPPSFSKGSVLPIWLFFKLILRPEIKNYKVTWLVKSSFFIIFNFCWQHQFQKEPNWQPCLARVWVSEKSIKISEWLGRQARQEIEPGSFHLLVLRTEPHRHWWDMSAENWASDLIYIFECINHKDTVAHDEFL